MASPSCSSWVSDIHALTNVLAQISVHSNSTPTKSLFKDDGNRMHSHIATLLTRDGMDEVQADISLACVSLYRHFAVFAVQQAPFPSEPISRSSSLSEDPPVSRNTTKGASDRKKIRLESLVDLQSSLASRDKVEAVLKTGLKAADLNQHVSDVYQILLGFSAYDLPEDGREERQARCFIFLLQRSIEKLTQRFHGPRIFFPNQYTPWWRIFIQWDPDPERFPAREINVRDHIALILNALSPGLLSYNQPLVLDCDTAVKCITGLAVLLDVIDGKIAACKVSTRSPEDWDRLNTTLRMLYSLLYETEALRHIFYHSSLSTHVLSLSRAAQYGEIRVDNGEKHDGPFLFRQLQKIVAWHRSLFIIASTKVVRAAIPIKFNLLTIPSPPPSIEVTPIMNLVNEIYPSRHHRALIRSYLACRGVSNDFRAFSPHYNASLLGILMTTDYYGYSDVFEQDVASDPRRIREMKDVRNITGHLLGKEMLLCLREISVFTRRRPLFSYNGLINFNLRWTIVPSLVPAV
ncbi:hypothetical protein MSAN_00683000 [Mycena sanguinolenta]|uniref:Uncharacterized protein n=1 Tax=Mycena sanguinolenta TaxID=230812 RepID=A0A8H7DGG9_9AGAR|nr:hypothetical protein MSAN_00683000 [Mycena sanguinolenta]